MAWLLYAAGALAAAAAVGLALLAGRLAMGLGGDRTGELVLGALAALLALFCAGVCLLAARAGREHMRMRQTLYYPGF